MHFKIGLVLLVFCSIGSVLGYKWDDQLDKQFSALSEATKKIQDLVAQESKAIPEDATRVDDEDKSREELEPPQPGEKVVDADASADDDSGDNKSAVSSEKPPKPTEEDSDEDDNDSGDEGISDFTGYGSLNNIFKFLRQPAIKPWWQGSNVCVEREVREEDASDSKSSSSGDGFLVFGVGISQFSSCKQSPARYICSTVTTKNGKTTKATVIYQCCHGNRRLNGKQGCQKVETKSILETVKEVGCELFERACEKEGIYDLLSGNKTIFMPLDDAFENFKLDEQSGNSVLINEVGSESPASQKMPTKREILKNHIVPGVYDSADFEHEMLLPTIDNKTLRINGYRTGVTTVNCALLNVTNKLTPDSVIHAVEKVLPPVTKSLADLLEEERFYKFRMLLDKYHLLEPLKGGETATVFALTNDQVDLLEPKHAMCMQTIIRHHILPFTFCTEAVRYIPISVMDLSTNTMYMERSQKDDAVKLDRTALIVEGDKVATNGVLHVVDTFMIPSSARSATDLLQQTNHTRFLSLLEKVGLKKEIDKSAEITLFVPVDSELDELEKLDADKLKEILLFHMATGKFESDDLDNGVTVPTRDGDETIRVTAKANVLSALMGQDSALSVQCVPLTRVDGRICNGIAHEIAKPLTPANSKLFDIIENDQRFTLFREALKGTKLEQELKSGQLGGPITLLAPTSDAFKSMRASALEKIATDKDAADSFLRAHILTDAVCCSNVGPSSWPFVSTVRTLNGAALPTNRRGALGVSFGGISVDECDIIARDGIIHTLDGVLIQSKLRNSPFADEEILIRKPNSDIILTGL